MSLLWVRASAEEPYLHASDVLFEPGDTIHPASALSGVSSRWRHTEHYSPDHVYLYRASEVHPDFRLQGGAVYEVRPHGEVEPDPEVWRRSETMPGAYRTRGPVTVTRVVRNDWRDPMEDIPPGLRGGGWSPSQQPRAQHPV